MVLFKNGLRNIVSQWFVKNLVNDILNYIPLNAFTPIYMFFYALLLEGPIFLYTNIGIFNLAHIIMIDKIISLSHNVGVKDFQFYSMLIILMLLFMMSVMPVF